MKSPSASEARVIRAIANLPPANGGHQASFSKIARATKLSQRRVIQIIQSLVNHGVIAKQGGQGANQYLFLVATKITKNRVWVCETEACNASQTESCNSGSADAPSNNSTAIDQRVDLFGNLIDCGPERVHSSRVAKPRSVSAPVIDMPLARATKDITSDSSLRSESSVLDSSLRSESLSPQKKKKKGPPPSVHSAELTDRMRAAAEKEGVHSANVEPMFAKFRAWHIENETKTRRPDLAWLRWIERAKEFEPELFAVTAPPSPFGNGNPRRGQPTSGYRPDLHQPDYGLEAIARKMANPFGTGAFNPASCPPSDGEAPARKAPPPKRDYSAEKVWRMAERAANAPTKTRITSTTY